MANVIPTELTVGMGGGGGTSYTTASIAPTANRLILLAVFSRKSTSTINPPTVTGAGMTWTQVVTRDDVAHNNRFTIFRALSATPGSGILTIDFSGDGSQQMCHWEVTSWNNVDTGGSNGANAVPQSKGVTNNNSTTSMTGTLDSSITKTDNAVYGGMGLVDVIGAGITPNNGETELADQSNFSTFNWRSQFQWRQGTNNQMSWTYTSGGNQPTGAFVEIKAGLSSGLFMGSL